MGDDHDLPRYAQGSSRPLPDLPSPDDLAPSRREERPGSVVRALSVTPLLLVAAMGMVAVVSWVLILVFGIGSGDPIWRWVEGRSAAEVLWQVLLAIAVGLAPLAVTALASWAALYGLRAASGRLFWTVLEASWGAAAVGLVMVDRTRQAWLVELGFGRTDWWFAFGVVAFAMVMAGWRLRALRAAG